LTVGSGSTTLHSIVSKEKSTLPGWTTQIFDEQGRTCRQGVSPPSLLGCPGEDGWAKTGSDGGTSLLHRWGWHPQPTIPTIKSFTFLYCKGISIILSTKKPNLDLCLHFPKKIKLDLHNNRFFFTSKHQINQDPSLIPNCSTGIMDLNPDMDTDPSGRIQNFLPSPDTDMDPDWEWTENPDPDLKKIILSPLNCFLG